MLFRNSQFGAASLRRSRPFLEGKVINNLLCNIKIQQLLSSFYFLSSVNLRHKIWAVAPLRKSPPNFRSVLMLPPCYFLLYSSNIIVTLTEETNRPSHSDTKNLDHFNICNITI